MTEHDVHNLILDFRILDFGFCEFFQFHKSEGVLLGFDILDSLAFSFFVRFLIIFYITQHLTNGQHLPLFCGFEKCVVEHKHCFITICMCENVGKYKNDKQSAFPFVVWGLKIRVLSTGTGNLNLSGRRQADAARGQRGELA